MYEYELIEKHTYGDTNWFTWLYDKFSFPPQRNVIGVVSLQVGKYEARSAESVLKTTQAVLTH